MTARIPAVVRDVELSDPLPAMPSRDATGRRADRAFLLLRRHTEPLALVPVAIPDEGLAPARLAAALTAALGPGRIADAVAAATPRARHGGHSAADQPAAPDGAPAASTMDTPEYLRRRAEVLRAAPELTVAICTRDRAELLAQCLDAVAAQRYSRFRVLVVDNAPRTDATRRCVEAARARHPVEIDYLVAPRAGASNARNVALAATRGSTVAFVDDDAQPDPYWLAEIARAFADHPTADAVTGPVVPLVLDSPAQLWFEQYGGLSKGRGFREWVFGPGGRDRQHPLYPLPPVGSGVNMTLRPGAVARIGRFDPALGGGAPALGGEDTLAFMTLLAAGGTVVYHPGALVRHRHRDDLAGLRSQLVGYGSGLTAAYTALVCRRPASLLTLARLAPRALHDLFAAGSPRMATIGPDFPRDLLTANRHGMLRGPLWYLRGRRAARHSSTPPAPERPEPAQRDATGGSPGAAHVVDGAT
ncbi:glycosyltransferase [Actinocatenispora sera]|uniref:glycosyltransferase family 2 protein n=1 Tax=Actinocatenispora sera TaxID=390989 RepID=UPI0033F26F00